MRYTYRLLTADEWPKVEPLLNGRPTPNPEFSAIAVAEDENGGIHGMLVLQLQWHLEPLVLTTPAVSFMRLKEVIDNQLKQHPGTAYYAFIDDPHVGMMAERAGLEPMPHMAFIGRS